MPPFKDEQIIIIAPGSQTTLAQLGLPESFTPAKLRVKSRMFPSEKEGEWDSIKIRKRRLPPKEGQGKANDKEKSEAGSTYEEDPVSEEGAVWPIVKGKIVDWECFFALITHVYNTLNPPFHTPILLISQGAWTPREHEKLCQFFFEKFKTPAFALMDAAVAALYAFGVHSGTVVDVGYEKADITPISEFLIHDNARTVSLPQCGGSSLTDRLAELLGPKGFTSNMCEQLKKSMICEILPSGTLLPGDLETTADTAVNPVATASKVATGPGPDTASHAGAAPQGPAPNAGKGEEANGEEEKEGVLDVASIVARGNMSEFLARKEKEKAEKAAHKKGRGATAAQPTTTQKPTRLQNSKRERNAFIYEDFALLDALKDLRLGDTKTAEAPGSPTNGHKRADETEGNNPAAANGTSDAAVAPPKTVGTIRREVEVGIERFQAATGGILDRLADAIYRTISSVEEVNKRSELWDCLMIVGNGAKVRGFKDALLANLQSRYLISPSSATIFTSELPSNISTPIGTGANTPQPQYAPHGGGSQVNPLLLAATTAQSQHLHPSNPGPPLHSHSMHSSHGQTPTSMKLAKPPEYFPEWKDVGFDEAVFLGAQVAAKVLFIVDQGMSKGYMTRPDYNDQGPMGIHDYVM